MINRDQELIIIHHGIVDAIMAIVANLFLIDQISKNGAKVFIHNGVTIELSTPLIILGLRVNLKEYLINECGEKEGLTQTYNVLKSMYFESTNKEPIALTPEGLELLNTLFVDVSECSQYEYNTTIH